MIGAVLPWKERIFRLQLQFFSLRYVGINCCNVTPFLYRVLSLHNIICTNFVPSGTERNFTVGTNIVADLEKGSRINY